MEMRAGVRVVVRFELWGAEFSGPFCAGVSAAEWDLACAFVGFSEPGVGIGWLETVGLSAVGVLADVLMAVELVFALLLTTSSSSSDEMSTTI